MSNPNDWQAPGASPSAPPIAPPVTGTYAPPPPGSWAPPPRPGLIPLRPLTLGAILGASFRVLRRNPRPTFGLSLALSGASFLLFVIVAGAVAAVAFARISSASESDQPQIIAGSLLTGGITLIIPLAASVATTGIMQGIVALEVARGTVGEKLRSGGLFRLARGRIWALIGFALLETGAVFVGVLVAAIAVTLLIALGGTAGIVAGVLLAVVAVLVLLAAGLFIGTKLLFVPSVLLLERLTLGKAITRSWRLTDGAFWRTLGIWLLTYVITSAAGQVVSVPISLLTSLATGFLAPTGDTTTTIVIFVVAELLAGVVGLVIGAVTTVMLSATSALLYIDQRMRREGLDLELMRFVEARQAGDPTVADPYLTVRDAPSPRPV